MEGVFVSETMSLASRFLLNVELTTSNVRKLNPLPHGLAPRLSLRNQTQKASPWGRGDHVAARSHAPNRDRLAEHFLPGMSGNSADNSPSDNNCIEGRRCK